MRRAHGFFQLRAYAGVIEDYTEVLRRPSNNPDAYYECATAYAALQMHTKAVMDFSQAIRLRPVFAAAYRGRSLSRRMLEDVRGAEEDSRKANELERGSRP